MELYAEISVKNSGIVIISQIINFKEVLTMAIFNDSKNKILLVVVAAAAIILASVFVPGILAGKDTYAASEGNTENRRTMYVSGSAKVTAVPDIAYATMGVVIENADAKVAQNENAKLMDKVVKAILAAGVAEDDIKTQGYSISPKYDYNRDTGESKIIGYSVRNSVEVTIRNVEKTGAIIDAATEAGANLSGGIRFGLSDSEKYYKEALAKAVIVAKERAETIADALGVKLKLPYEITETGSSYPVYVSRDYAKLDEASALTTPIEPGTLDINASVSIKYEY
jgi:uncharacterized protein YggE